MNQNPTKNNFRTKFTETQLSKKLSWLLRHGAVEEGLSIQADGFVNIAAILSHPNYSPYYTKEILERLVAKDGKQRFMLRLNEKTNEWEIRANQGHSINAVKSEESLERIISIDSIPMAVHGTYYRNWENIRKQGLRRMNRNHVHFATFDVLSEAKFMSRNCGAMSGFRSDCEILIYLDLLKVLKDKSTELFRSANGVVLCAGIAKTDCIPVEFFAKVIDRRTGKHLEY